MKKTSCLNVLLACFFSYGLRSQTPELSVSSAPNTTLVLSWPATPSHYVLEAAFELKTAAWQTIDQDAAVVNTGFRLVISSADTTRFFRLRLAPTPLPADDFDISEYILISSRSIGPSLLEESYKALASNWGAVDATVTAILSSARDGITLSPGSLNFGQVPSGATIESTGTFTLLRDPSKPLTEEALVWNISATALPPTSFALIESARTRGVIDGDTALLYNVYAEFNDEHLPTQYLGRNDGFAEARGLIEAAAQFDTLSPATQKLVAPYLLRADAPGSWY